MNSDIPVSSVESGVQTGGAACPLESGAWYVVREPGRVLSFALLPGSLAGARWLSADFLLQGTTDATFGLDLHDRRAGRTFRLRFGMLPLCSGRLRLPLNCLDLSRWRLPREGAFLKPHCKGDPVDQSRVDLITLDVIAKADGPVEFCISALRASAAEPPPTERPILPRGALLDRLGQSAVRNWPGKTRDEEELRNRLRRRMAETDSGANRVPAGWSRWGGWAAKTWDATGFFRTHHDGRRWWLVDPDGHPFWSAGCDCVRADIWACVAGIEPALEWDPAADPDFAEAARTPGCLDGRNFLAANLIRAFGAEGWREAWRRLGIDELRPLRFNTIGNWSDWEFLRGQRLPYVRPMARPPAITDRVYRDFPDVFSPDFEREASAFARPLETSAGDPAMIGYFLMNEPDWGFGSLTPAEGMLRTGSDCECRRELARRLGGKYGGDEGLARAWGPGARLEAVASGPWRSPLTEAARADLEAFSTVMVERLFAGLSAACRGAAPEHLNLGMRFYKSPPEWALRGMKGFDVFSINCYRPMPPADEIERLAAAAGAPVIIGEWHFGALDVGLPASGIGRVRTQADRGRAYRSYVEHAAATPGLVGAHWFTLYDQSALGRPDGENYNIGFLDVCSRPYPELASAAITAHERLHALAASEAEPFDDRPEYLPMLFL